MKFSLIISISFVAFVLASCSDLVTVIPDVPPQAPQTPPVADGSVPVSQMPQAQEVPEVPEVTLIQDGEDAFKGFGSVDIPEGLQGEFTGVSDGIRTFIEVFGLRTIANEEGVKAHARIRTSERDQTTWEYELTNLPDDSVSAENYKVYFEKTGSVYTVARIGHRAKCYRGDAPGQWTTKLCP
jgi:hypothetical protein